MSETYRRDEISIDINAPKKHSLFSRIAAKLINDSNTFIESEIAHQFDEKYTRSLHGRAENILQKLFGDIVVSGLDELVASETYSNSHNHIDTIHLHFSELDFIVSKYIEMENNIQMARILGGVNLKVPFLTDSVPKIVEQNPVLNYIARKILGDEKDPLIAHLRKCGMIGIDRKMTDNKTYMGQFFTYAHQFLLGLTHGGFQDFQHYAYDGRSKNGLVHHGPQFDKVGNMVSPDGFKSTFTEAIHIANYILSLDSQDRRVIVPVGNTYERVMEDWVFPTQARNKVKGPRHQKLNAIIDIYAGLLLARQNQEEKGDVYVDFGEPIVLDDYKYSSDLVQDVKQSLQNLSRVTPTSIVAYAIRQGFNNDGSYNFADLADDVEALVERIGPNVRYSRTFDSGDIREIVNKGLILLNEGRNIPSFELINGRIPFSSKILGITPGDYRAVRMGANGEMILNQEHLINYYANMIEHHVPK